MPLIEPPKNAAMIPKEPTTNHWSTELKQAVRDPLQVCKLLDIDPASLPGGLTGLQTGADLFSTLVPWPFLRLMQKGNPKDPLLLQVLPQGVEAQQVAGFVADPLQEKAHNPLPGVIHKYASRLLLTTSGACAVNCRYCFRRHFPYAENSLGRTSNQELLDYLRQHPQINEVIFSGGDPLAAADTRLAALTADLASLPQLTRLRIHSRLPVVVPSRINTEFLSWVEATRLQVILVLHVNHSQEIGADLAAAAAKLHKAGVLLLNQSVLLQGINAQAEVLAQLSERLFELKILPYYLHTLDKVAGAAHFAVSTVQARQIHAQLLALLPGFLVPKLVTEEAGRPSKTPLGW